MIHTDIYVPAVDSVFEFMLDETATVEEASREIADILQKKLGGGQQDASGFALYDCGQKRRLRSAGTLGGQQVKNGSRLLFV